MAQGTGGGPPGGYPPGRGPDLHAAMMDAYDKAKAGGGSPPFEVLKIELHGTNPFTDYKITVG